MAKKRSINTSGSVPESVRIPHQKMIDFFWSEYDRGNTKLSIADVMNNFGCRETCAKESLQPIASLQWVMVTYGACGNNARYRLSDRVATNNWRVIGQCGDRIHPCSDFKGLTVYRVPPGVNVTKVARSALPDEWKVG